MKLFLPSLLNYSEIIIQMITFNPPKRFRGLLIEHSKGHYVYSKCKSTKQKLQALYICVLYFAVSSPFKMNIS